MRAPDKTTRALHLARSLRSILAREGHEATVPACQEAIAKGYGRASWHDFLRNIEAGAAAARWDPIRAAAALPGHPTDVVLTALARLATVAEPDDDKPAKILRGMRRFGLDGWAPKLHEFSLTPGYGRMRDAAFAAVNDAPFWVERSLHSLEHASEAARAAIAADLSEMHDDPNAPLWPAVIVGATIQYSASHRCLEAIRSASEGMLAGTGYRQMEEAQARLLDHMADATRHASATDMSDQMLVQPQGSLPGFTHHIVQEAVTLVAMAYGVTPGMRVVMSGAAPSSLPEIQPAREGPLSIEGNFWLGSGDSVGPTFPTIQVAAATPEGLRELFGSRVPAKLGRNEGVGDAEQTRHDVLLIAEEGKRPFAAVKVSRTILSDGKPYEASGPMRQPGYRIAIKAVASPGTALSAKRRNAIALAVASQLREDVAGLAEASSAPGTSVAATVEIDPAVPGDVAKAIIKLAKDAIEIASDTLAEHIGVRLRLETGVGTKPTAPTGHAIH